MAKKVYEESKIAAIANKIREKTGGTDTYTTEKMPSGVDAVYDKGKEIGAESGKLAEYDTFWDAYQQNGNRTNYANSFYNVGWDDNSYNPKYDIVCVGNAYAAFAYSRITDTKKNIDISKVTNTGPFFNSSTSVKTIRNLIVSEATTFDSAFFNLCTALENLHFTGVIGKGTINLQWSSKLSKESIENVIGCLSNTTSGLTVTLSKTAVNTAFATTEGGTDGSTSEEWEDLIATKTNWTIALL